MHLASNHRFIYVPPPSDNIQKSIHSNCGHYWNVGHTDFDMGYLFSGFNVLKIFIVCTTRVSLDGTLLGEGCGVAGLLQILG